ncbi:hypothetical protein FRC04_009527 [Tulasnella sp. 424]|nr:hypothetical protein FRC04_009527 [Tulasnella sp. 424]KAG8974287.1 hypothetical protein FRC05_007711 [Tulasnella sp. 425]
MDDNIFVMNITKPPSTPFVPSYNTSTPASSPLRQSKHFGTAEARREKSACRRVEEYPKPTCAGVAQVDLSGGEEVRGSFAGAQARSRINTAIFNPLIATAELSSNFNCIHESIKQTQLQVVIDNWNAVVKTQD